MPMAWAGRNTGKRSTGTNSVTETQKTTAGCRCEHRSKSAKVIPAGHEELSTP